MGAEAACVVYQATNSVNGKFYIGATEKGMAARKRKHLANAKRGQNGKFYTAVRKHGAGSFEFSILMECRDFWHALDEERRLIAELKPAYNLTDGGGGVKGLKYSAESRAKMSVSAKKRKHRAFTAADQEKARIACKARRGIKITDPGHLRALQQTCEDMWKRRRRPVRCVSEALEFDSVTTAAAHYGVSAASIVHYCAKTFKARSGLEFEYIGGGDV